MCKCHNAAAQKHYTAVAQEQDIFLVRKQRFLFLFRTETDIAWDQKQEAVLFQKLDGALAQKPDIVPVQSSDVACARLCLFKVQDAAPL